MTQPTEKNKMLEVRCVSRKLDRRAWRLILGVGVAASALGCREKTASKAVPTPPGELSEGTTTSTPPKLPAKPQGVTPPQEVTRCPLVSRAPAPKALRATELTELSGLVASRDNPGLLWAHNDSGDRSRLFAVSESGELLGAVELGVRAVDWEDVAVRPRPGADEIYVADTGDNLSNRKGGVSIHRFIEPSREALDPHAPVTISPETMHFTYPQGPVDAEALLVDPASGTLYLVTKPRLSPPSIYSLDFSSPAHLENEVCCKEKDPRSEQRGGKSSAAADLAIPKGSGGGDSRRFEMRAAGTAKFVGEITATSAGHAIALVTGADVSADGAWIALRTYVDFTLFHRSPGESFEQALLGPGCQVESADEAQGEAIAFLAPSPNRSHPFLTIVTASEGAGSPLHRFNLSEADPPNKR